MNNNIYKYDKYRYIHLTNLFLVRIDGFIHNLIEFSFIGAVYLILTPCTLEGFRVLLYLYFTSLLSSLLYIPVYCINDFLNYGKDLKKSKLDPNYNFRLTIYLRNNKIVIIHAIFYIMLMFMMSLFNIIDYIIVIFILLVYLVAVLHSLISEKWRVILTFPILRLLKHTYGLLLLSYTLKRFNLINSLEMYYYIVYIVYTALFVSIPFITLNTYFMHKGKKIMKTKPLLRIFFYIMFTITILLLSLILITLYIQQLLKLKLSIIPSTIPLNNIFLSLFSFLCLAMIAQTSQYIIKGHTFPSYLKRLVFTASAWMVVLIALFYVKSLILC